jgi:uridine kinase
VNAVFADVIAAIGAAGPVGIARTVVVAIDGFGGAGKSTLAARIADELSVTVVHTDDFSSWDNPIDWWPRLLEQVLLPLSHNEVARYQRYDWDARELAEWIVVTPGGLVVLEGVTASRLAFRPYLSLTIWVDSPADLRLARGLQRDGAEMRGLWLAWMAAENEWAAHENPQARADLTISGAV